MANLFNCKTEKWEFFEEFPYSRAEEFLPQSTEIQNYYNYLLLHGESIRSAYEKTMLAILANHLPQTEVQ